jgi:hypothetical protein
MDINDLIKDPSKAREIISSKLYQGSRIKSKEDLELIKILLHYFGTSSDIATYLDYTKEKLDNVLETKLFENPNYTLFYVRSIIKDRYPKAEPSLSKDPEVAYRYAVEVLYGRFPEAEDLIAQYSSYSLNYALNVIGGRFEKGEEAIARDPMLSLKYAHLIMHGRFEKGEASMSKRVDTSFIYATRILKDRFKEGEKAIIKNKTYLQNYMNFLKGIGKLDEFLNDHPNLKKKLNDM